MSESDYQNFDSPTGGGAGAVCGVHGQLCN